MRTERRLTGLLAGLCLGLAVPGLAWGSASDREQPIHIEADRAEADDPRQVTIYRGDVVITQGTMRITGETVWIYYDENQDLTKLVSVGDPATFRQLPDGKDQYETADAKRLEWYADLDLVVMLGDARYGQGRDLITADRIVYDSLRGQMKADASDVPVVSESAPTAAPRSRVQIEIQPKQSR
jgi:lipopolysaccharide export system protein LptA